MRKQMLGRKEGVGSKPEPLSIAALFPGPFSIDWLFELCTEISLSPLLVNKRLDDAKKRGILSEIAPGTYHFKDSEKRKYYYSKLERLDDCYRALLIRKVKDLLLDEFEPNDEVLVAIGALLSQLTSLDLQECDLLMKAAKASLKLHKYENATRCYMAALQAVEQKLQKEADLDMQKSAVTLTVELCSVAGTDVESTVMHELLTRAISIADRLGLSNEKLLLEMHQAKYEFLAHGKPVYRELLAHAEGDDHEKLNNYALHFEQLRLYFLFWDGQLKKVLEIYDQVWENSDQAPVQVQALVAYAHAMVGNVSYGLHRLLTLGEECRSAGDFYRASFVHCLAGRILISLCKMQEARKLLEKSIEDARSGKNQRAFLLETALLSYVYSTLGLSRLASSYLSRVGQVGLESLWYDAVAQPYVLELMLNVQGNNPGLRAKTKELTDGTNSYLKGIALRVLAEFLKREGTDLVVIKEMLEQSISALECCGVTLEKARSQMEYARLLAHIGDQWRAAEELRNILREVPIVAEMIPVELSCLLDYDARLAVAEKAVVSLVSEAALTEPSAAVFIKYLETIAVVTSSKEIMLFSFSPQEACEPLIVACYSRDGVVNDPSDDELQLIKTAINSGRLVWLRGSGRHVVVFPICFRKSGCGAVLIRRKDALREKESALISRMVVPLGPLLVAISEWGHYDGETRATVWNTVKHWERKCLPIHLEDKGLGTEDELSQLVVASPVMRKVVERLTVLAKTDLPILLVGESGVGKTLLAKLIHKWSHRTSGPFVEINCGGLTPSLVNSELFGHERGAFTGAISKHVGKIERANRGTLFLDEVSELPPEAQSALLKVVETKMYERVGGNETLRSDFRIISATNRDLESEVKNARFRQDLYFRIGTCPIVIPPLRERKEDIIALFKYFVQYYSRIYNKSFQKIADSVLRHLLDYDWPGNVRELQSVVHTSVALSQEEFVLQLWQRSRPTSPEDLGVLKWEEILRLHILKALEESGGKIYGPGGAAERLGVKPTTLISRMKKLGVTCVKSYR